MQSLSHGCLLYDGNAQVVNLFDEQVDSHGRAYCCRVVGGFIPCGSLVTTGPFLFKKLSYLREELKMHSSFLNCFEVCTRT